MRLKQWIMRGAIHLCIGSMVLCAESVIYAFETVDYARRNSFMHWIHRIMHRECHLCV